MAARPRTLGQVVLVERHLRQQDNRVGADLRKRIKNENLTLGSNRVYHPDDVDAPSTAREPDTRKPVALKVGEALREAMEHSVRALDTVATKDTTNQHARAGIIVGTTTLIENVPMSHLLFLEDYLAEWRAFLDELPVLNPTRHWTLDPGTGEYRADPEENIRFIKEVVPLVLHPGTDKHPPQTQPLQKDIRVGRYVTENLSGAIPENTKKELLHRISMLIVAVKDAIARANQTPVIEVQEGAPLLGFVLGEFARP